jgi:hypothetical protein
MHAIGPEQMKDVLPAEEAPFVSPIPTQIVSSDEYLPAPQTDQQREVEARLRSWAHRSPRSRASAADGFSRPPLAWRPPTT